MMLSDHIAEKDNNFNLIRFIAAFSVLVSHSYAIHFGSADAEPLLSYLGKSLGSLSVDVFFIVSGFLIYGSLIRKQSLRDYIAARILRIFPGLIFMLILTTFVLGSSISSLTFINFLSEPQTWEYFLKNSILIFRTEYQLPGVFEDNNYGTAVNGSLWSLPFELYMYIALPVLLFGLKGIKSCSG